MTLKANELRIGNFVSAVTKDNIVEITEIYLGDDVVILI